MSDLTRIEANNAELRECIEIAESLPDAPQSVGGYDIATMQKLVDARGLNYLYSVTPNNYNLQLLKNEDLEWLAKVDLSKCTSTEYMFAYCKSNDWDTAPLFDMSNIVTMRFMFALNTNVGGVPTGKALHIPAYDTSKVTNMSSAFAGRKLAEFPQLRYDSALYCTYLFQKTEFPTNTKLGVLYLPQATEINYLFERAVNLISIEGVNAPKSKQFKYLFNDCEHLQTVGDIVTNESDVNLDYMFRECTALESFGKLPISTVSCAGMLYQSYMKVVSAIDLPNCTKMDSLLSYSGTTETVEYINMKSVTSASSMFHGCASLTNITLKNIKCNLIVGSGTSYGHLLTVDSLVGLCYELRDTGSNKTLTIGSANLAKLASVYVRLVDITDEMRAEDNLIDEKLPFERCESTDEGATLIGDYVLLKNWKLA